MTDSSPEYSVVCGPTASGKTQLALAMALKTDAEIISCDSVQVYQGFNIGTAKPTAAERQAVKHHLIDAAHCGDPYDASRFATEAQTIITNSSKPMLVVGGSGLYLRALWGYGYHSLPTDDNLRLQLNQIPTSELKHQLTQFDPERSAQIHSNDRVRLIRALELFQLTGKTASALHQQQPMRLFAPKQVILLHPERQVLHQRIRQRTQQMLKMGLIEEVEQHLKTHQHLCAPLQSIGYKQVVMYLNQEISKQELLDHIIAATNQYAKRQITWFKKLPFTTQIIQD